MRFNHIYVLIFCLLLGACQKDMYPESLINKNNIGSVEMVKIYNKAVDLGLEASFKEKSTNIKPDWNSISYYKKSNKLEVTYIPLARNTSGSEVLQFLIIKNNDKIHTQISEFLSKDGKPLRSIKDMENMSGTINIYFPNGKFLKSYFLVDGIVTGTVDKIPDDTFYSDPQKTKDDDLDGVPNALDKCPNTPANTMVDPDGCPVTNSIPEVIIYPPLPPTFPLPGIGWHDPGPNFPIFNPDGPQGPGGTGTIPDPTIPTTLLDSLLNSTNMTNAQKQQITMILQEMLKNCLGSTMYKHMLNNNVKFNWIVDNSFRSPAGYSPSTGNLTINNPSTLTVNGLLEEFFHAYQNRIIPGGIGQYNNHEGKLNIEFEAKVIRDLMLNLEGVPGQMALSSQAYSDWLKGITDNWTGYPDSFTQNQLNDYYDFMNQFKTSGGYPDLLPKAGMDPQAMFDWLDESDCL